MKFTIYGIQHVPDNLQCIKKESAVYIMLHNIFVACTVHVTYHLHIVPLHII